MRVRRLLTMSPSEIAVRGRQVTSKWWDRMATHDKRRARSSNISVTAFYAAPFFAGVDPGRIVKNFVDDNLRSAV